MSRNIIKIIYISFSFYHEFPCFHQIKEHWQKQSCKTLIPQSILRLVHFIIKYVLVLGSLFLWIYWPSFNSALTVGENEYHRAVVNTYLSLAAATVSFYTSVLHIIGNRQLTFPNNYRDKKRVLKNFAINFIKYFCEIVPASNLAYENNNHSMSKLAKKSMWPTQPKNQSEHFRGINLSIFKSPKKNYGLNFFRRYMHL